MWGFYCIAFIEYMLPGKTLLDYTDLFSPNDYRRIIYKYFKDKCINSWLQIKKIDETRNFLSEEINHNGLII